MASLDRQVTQNGLGVNNVMVRENVKWCRRGYRRGFLVCKTRRDDGEVADVDDELEVMMSCGVLDVDTKMMEIRP